MNLKQVKMLIAALWLAVVLLALFTGHIAVAVVVGSLAAAAMNRPSAQVCAVTLSVPEILKNVMDAFKIEAFELFGEKGFVKDFSSNTAVLGDKITGRISHVPVIGTYDPNNGGFKAAAQDVTTLIEDVPVTIGYMPSVTIKIGWLSGLSSKVDLYNAAVANKAYALAKAVLDSILRACVGGNISNSFTVSPSLVTLDTFDTSIRAQLNSQKIFNDGRFCILNSGVAGILGLDDRVKSKLFVGELNGSEGIRRWTNMAGFSWIREYPDFPITTPKVVGVAGDSRLVAVSVRKIQDSASIARALGIPVVMEFFPIRDEATGLELMGITWQEQGTGDLYLSVVILYGLSVGNQGGPVGSMTDNAGCLLITP